MQTFLSKATRQKVEGTCKILNMGQKSKTGTISAMKTDGNKFSNPSIL